MTGGVDQRFGGLFVSRHRFPALSAKEPPTRGHNYDMGTTQNTAALYLCKSSLNDRSVDNRSISDQRHDLECLADRHGLQIVAEYEEKVGTSAPVWVGAG